MKLVSIITINYNNDEGLRKTLTSVESQSFQNFEFIVIDGNSQDKSVDSIKQCGRIDIWESEKDAGIYDAQNKGIKKATGEYLLFLNSGDVLVEKDTLLKVASHLHSTDIIYGDLITVDSSGFEKTEISSKKLDIYHFMISTLWHPCTFIKSSVFKTYGNYDPKLKITADYEFFIRTILKNKVSYKHIPIPISKFDLSGVSNDPANEKLQIEERKKSWLKNYSPVQLKAFELYTKLLRRLGRK